MVQEIDPLDTGSRDNGWRRKTFRILSQDGSSHAPDLEVHNAEEDARIDEFYNNAFDTIPDPNDESATLLSERFENSQHLLKGISLKRVLDHAVDRYAREAAKLVSGDPQIDFDIQLEKTFTWSRLKELSDFITAGMVSSS